MKAEYIFKIRKATKIWSETNDIEKALQAFDGYSDIGAIEEFMYETFGDEGDWTAGMRVYSDGRRRYVGAYYSTETNDLVDFDVHYGYSEELRA